MKHNEMARFLQANLNHARHAQNLFLHTLGERGIGLGIATEPHQVPQNHPGWVTDKLGSVAMKWSDVGGSAPWTALEKGEGMVAVKWGRVVVVGTYLPPSLNMVRFEHRLDQLTDCINKYRTDPIVIAGDFNAKAAL